MKPSTSCFPIVLNTMVVYPPASESRLLLAMTAFSDFKRSFKGDLITEDHPDYELAIKRWAANAARRASLVAFARCAEDVSFAVRYASCEKIEGAIKGVGHNPAGSSSSEGGIVIDLSRYMNWCRVDAERKLAYVGGGATWKTVDETAIKYGLATVGGTVNHVRIN